MFFKRFQKRHQERETIVLNFESIHFQGGHAGSETVYYTGAHKVVYKRWLSSGKTPKPEVLKLPASIGNQAEVLEYVKQHKPFWITRTE